MQKLESPYKNTKKRTLGTRLSSDERAGRTEKLYQPVSLPLLRRDKSHLQDHSKFYFMKTLFFLILQTNSPFLRRQSYTQTISKQCFKKLRGKPEFNKKTHVFLQ